MRKLNLAAKLCGVFLLFTAAAVALSAQTFTTLYGFTASEGNQPYAGLVQGVDGDLYGTTFYGRGSCTEDDYGCGTIFKITPTGTLTTLHQFNGSDGYSPMAALIQGTDGNFYGTTSDGGAEGIYSYGTVFEVTPGGTLTTLHSFETTDGNFPFAGLTEGADHSFYGTTERGGANGGGTVFKITPGGTLTTLYNFCPGQQSCPDGREPSASLVLASDGNFYGTTYYGGANICGAQQEQCGTVFEIIPSGALTTLYNFSGADGASPDAGLVQGIDGNFYGTTVQGGSNHSCYYGSGCGTVFKITPNGTLTTLHNFCSQPGCPGGYGPTAGLVQGTDGNFYGTLSDGKSGVTGAIFSFTSTGTLSTLHTFDGTDGAVPYGGLVQGTDRNFYGTTSAGGNHGCAFGGCGTVFSVSVGLGPFVETNPVAGKVGAKVGILGTDLTGATSVTFNGTAADFKVRSQTLIVAEVPSGATTGTVQVQLPSGPLSSNVLLIVLP